MQVKIHHDSKVDLNTHLVYRISASALYPLYLLLYNISPLHSTNISGHLPDPIICLPICLSFGLPDLHDHEQGLTVSIIRQPRLPYTLAAWTDTSGLVQSTGLHAKNDHILGHVGLTNDIHSVYGRDCSLYLATRITTKLRGSWLVYGVVRRVV